MAAEPWKSRRPWPLLVPLGVYALLLAWIGFSAAAVQGYDFSYLLYALANLIVFTDAIDFGLRLYVHRRHTAVTADLSRGAVRQLSIDLPAAQRKLDRKSTRLNSSHSQISYAVFCLKKKTPILSTATSPFHHRTAGASTRK